jgi:N-methylhydantoinase A/oxoprolinase/acetone carboxylase beta subunit
VLPEIKEYERTSTTVINTYVLPIVRRYLATLRAGLDGIGVRVPLLIMQSNGGLMTDAAAAAMPMHIIESGPAAGVVGAQALARRIGFDKLITFDMGGTTAKASLVEDGAVSPGDQYQVGGGIMHGSRLLTGAVISCAFRHRPRRVGAGNGSIVWRDAGGALSRPAALARPGAPVLRPRRHRADRHRRQRRARLPEPDDAGRRRRETQCGTLHEIFRERCAPLGLPLAGRRTAPT